MQGTTTSPLVTPVSSHIQRSNTVAHKTKHIIVSSVQTHASSREAVHRVFDQQRMKVWQNTVRFFWELMYSSFYRISLTTKIFQALFCSAAPSFSLQDQTWICSVSLFHHSYSLSFKTWAYVWAKWDWEEYTVWRMFMGGLGWNGKRGLFIWRKFIYCNAYHSKVHASRAKEERGHGWILWIFTPPTHPLFVVLYYPLFPVCACLCSCVRDVSLLVSPPASPWLLKYLERNYVSNLRELIK